MTRLRSVLLAAGMALLCPFSSSALAQPSPLTQKLNAYIGCINRLSERSYDSRERYFSWAPKKGPTGKERIVYGTYTIYDTSGCKQDVAAANALEPHEPELEDAASAYVEAVTALEPLLKETNAYYEQEDYKDDKMAKGKALHPRLVAAWEAFAAADTKLRERIETIQDKAAVEKLAEIEKSEGRKAHYYIEALMMSAKRLIRLQTAEPPDLARITEALAEYESLAKATEEYAGSVFNTEAKGFLVTSKQLMRRVRDKVPYSNGDKMMLNAGSGWMVEGSVPRLTRDYNELVDSYNMGPLR